MLLGSIRGPSTGAPCKVLLDLAGTSDFSAASP